MALTPAHSTIAAIATAPGRGGVGVVRISGPKALHIAQQLLGFIPKNRYAHFCPFKNPEGQLLDEGIALFFKGPHSFTGEDVLELQGHGGPVLLDRLLEACLKAGAQPAGPGEFSQRAYLNDKIDLVQAEAIADLIAASSERAAQQALNSLQGHFSKAVHGLVDTLIALRIYVEAAIDFPEEEVDFLNDGHISLQLGQLITAVITLLAEAKQGHLVREGMTIVLAGRPNAGKSSLLNALTEQDTAIVSDIAGTTRDTLREQIHLDGMPLHIVDTAGLHSHSQDPIEQIGMARARQALSKADRILLVVDSRQTPIATLPQEWPEFFNNPQELKRLTVVLNKSDLTPVMPLPKDFASLAISAKTGAGLDTLKHHLKQIMGFESTTEGAFSARRRHLDALQQALNYLQQGQQQLQQHQAGELLAEDLKHAQDALGQITGAFTADDLLGQIFSSFCIGK